jgi:GH24 family phage-related lysozyme (muramidase)
MATNNRLLAAAALATAIAIPAEGLRQYAYRDPPGILTVCFGSTTNVVAGRKYSLQECREFLDRDMLKAVQTVEKCQPNLPENVLAAFSDAVYNIGPSVACESTAARLLRSGDIQGACDQLPRWVFANVAGVNVKLPGLVKRREAERRLCRGES